MTEILTNAPLTISYLVQPAILVTGILGSICVARKNTLGFWAWIASNLLLIMVSVQKELWGMVAMYVFYLATCIYSIWYWRSAKTE